MATIYYEKDADPAVIKDRRVAVIGYGSQGHAHALNLKESGIDVVVGLKEGSSSPRQGRGRRLDGHDAGRGGPLGQRRDAARARSAHGRPLQTDIAPNLDRDDALLFAHGFNIHFAAIEPPGDVDVLMVAPKGPGHLVRRTFTEGSGVPCLLAVHQDATGKASDLGLSYAWGIGGTRAGVLLTTFKEETETDLFGEQVILCGGLSQLIKNAYETLVEAGYQPESAYFETLHELKLIVDLLYEGGLSWMRYSISDTAEYGDYTRGSRIVNEESKAEMRKVLDEIQSGAFANEWLAQAREGAPFLLEQRAANRNHPIEVVGAELRELMPFMKPKHAP